jgi:type I restriction enzyme, R subunit
LQSNFTYIKAEFPEVYELGVQTERLLRVDARGSAFHCRLTLETAIKWLFAHEDCLTMPYKPKGLGAFVYDRDFEYIVPGNILSGIHLAMKIGNKASHTSGRIQQFDALKALEATFAFVKWVAHYYGRDCDKDVTFDASLITTPAEEAKKLQQAERDRLLKETESRFQTELDQLQSRSEEQVAALKSEMAQLKAKNSEVEFASEFNPNEADTRKLYIDLLLEEVGWDLSDPRVREYKAYGMPTVSKVGYVDYVLWGDDGKPLAVVEAKKAMRSDKEGKQQAKLYADCLEKMHGQRPVMFYTNGFETHIWDDLSYAERLVYGFYDKSELMTLIARRTQSVSLRSMSADTEIAGRPYQIRAVRKVLDAFEDRHRKALLVMATGSGKTRTAVALVKCLTQANRVKRVLFLADRTALVTQAMNRSFKVHLPNMSLVNLVEEKETDQSRVVFSTYQTMMNLIDEVNDNGTRKFGVGHFDLVIIDESHRSIYKRYGAIFDYFDAHLLGLTATPRSEIDRNTYAIFDMPDNHPTDVYSLKNAVEDHFLVPYKLKKVDLKFPTDGIKYEDLSEDEKEEYEATFTDELTGEMPTAITSSAVNRWLFNKDTVRTALDIVMEHGLKVGGGDTLGKTIVFARNHDHAEFIVEVFDEMYPQYRGHFCQVIDNRCKNPQDMIDDFSEPDKAPQIAVSIDMLDTGIDVPEVLNLIFFKPVKSKAKFWQMIGRGTRLCEDLFGPGLDKEFFAIFDFCKNFEFFGENPQGFIGGTVETLSQKIFKAWSKLAFYLQQSEYQEDTESKAVQEYCIDWLRNQIAEINADSALVRKERRYVEKYRHPDELDELNESKVNELIEHISHLPIPCELEDEMKKRFDAQMLHLQLSLIEKTKDQKRIIKNLQKTAEDLLKKSNIPSVAKQLPLLKMISENEFWQDINVGTVERIRKDLRELIKFLDDDDASQRTYYTNFIDDINVNDPWKNAENLGDEFKDYREVLSRYLDKHTDISGVWKLKNNIALSPEDIVELEKIIYSSEVSNKEQFDQYAQNTPLGLFIRTLVGMERQAVSEAFAGFLSENTFNSRQIDCIDIIIDHFVNNGLMEKKSLTKQPFKDYHAEGIIGLFGRDNMIKLVNVIEEINQTATG